MKSIGTITKTHGFEGAVVVRSKGLIAREPEPGEPVFIIIDGIPVPFFTREAYSPSPDTLVISFDDYMTAESVIALKGCEMKSGEGDQPGNEFAELIDYQIIDEPSGFKGTIVSVIRNPGQLIANVRSKRGEVLIPLHPDLIITVDHKRRTVVMSLPSGLTGVND